MARVSVLVITYNHSNYIQQCLDSILFQKTSFSFEILVHDDASNDGTQEIIRSYQERYPNIKTVLQKENQFLKGKVHPDEALFSLISGKYVCIIEGDDYWYDETKLQRQYDALENNGECSICVHKIKCIDKAGNDLGIVKGDGLFKEGIISSEIILKTFFLKNNWAFQTSSYFMRTSIFLNRPPFWKKFYVGDLPLILWFVHNGSFFFIDDIMSCYRMFSDGSATNSNRTREYAIRKAKTNAEGLIAFNEYTNKVHWQYIKHITSFYLYQYYCATKKVLSKDYFLVAKTELSVKERLTAKIKYTKIGYRIRNIREDIYKNKIKRRKFHGT